MDLVLIGDPPVSAYLHNSLIVTAADPVAAIALLLMPDEFYRAFLCNRLVIQLTANLDVGA
jgi:hypothetical protein